MQFPSYKNELQQLAQGFHFVAGCDEVGVAPVAGPVVASACILDPNAIGSYRSKNKWYYRVRDSKTVNEKEREALVDEIKAHCLSFGIGESSPEEIDAINIHHASLLAMNRAVVNMLIKFHERYEHVNKSDANLSQIFLFLDGRFVIKELHVDKEQGLVNKFKVTQRAVVDGDAKILSISAASIIAKVYRDNILKQLHEQFPSYGFARHKGYNTQEHRQAILKNGVTQFHRKSFLKNMLGQRAF